MKYYQYIRILAKMIPQEVWDNPHYAPHIEANGSDYLKIRRDMHGLKEASISAFKQPVTTLPPTSSE